MIQIIGLLTIVGFILYFGLKYKEWEGPIFFGTIFLPFFLFLTIIFSGVFKQETNRINHSIPIISLTNSSQISGSFFIGCGSVNQKEYYFVFTKDSDGAFVRKKISSSNARIFLTNKENPQLFWQEIKYKTPLWFGVINYFNSEYTIIDIYVPENAIIQKFEVQ